MQKVHTISARVYNSTYRRALFSSIESNISFFVAIFVGDGVFDSSGVVGVEPVEAENSETTNELLSAFPLSLVSRHTTRFPKHLLAFPNMVKQHSPLFTSLVTLTSFWFVSSASLSRNQLTSGKGFPLMMTSKVKGFDPSWSLDSFGKGFRKFGMLIEAKEGSTETLQTLCRSLHWTEY